MSNFKIMILDDDPTTLVLMTNIFKKAAVEVISFASSSDALKSAKTEEYDVIITDMRMPMMSGLEFLQRIKASINYSPLLIVISAVKESDKLKAAYQLGISQWIEKPFSEIEIHNLIEKVKMLLKVKNFNQELINELNSGGV